MSGETRPVSDLEAALVATVDETVQDGLLVALATEEVAVPHMADTPPDRGLTLPFLERFGFRYALVFSSRQRAADFDLEPHEIVMMRGEDLGAAWPTDEEVWLAIDPGSAHGATLSPGNVRSLPSYVG